jgi:hypothetical protein
LTISTKVPLRFVTYHSEVAKIAIKTSDRFIVGHNILRIQKKIFLHNMDFMASKGAEFHKDFKNMNFHGEQN